MVILETNWEISTDLQQCKVKLLERIEMSHNQLCKASHRRSYIRSQLHGKQASQVQDRSGEDLEQSR